MKIKMINNKKRKRAFNNGFWIKKGIMFPFENIKFIQIGLFGYIFLITYIKINIPSKIKVLIGTCIWELSEFFRIPLGKYAPKVFAWMVNSKEIKIK